MNFTSLVESRDPELCSFFGLSNGYWNRREAEEEACKVAAEQMMRQNEELRTKDQFEAYISQYRIVRGLNPSAGNLMI